MSRLGSLLLALGLGVMPLAAEEAPPQDVAPPQPRGYVDLDRDGLNDRFRDANGDGIDDVGGRSYPHRFRFADADQDGINDVFVDQDGDGVNDLDARYQDQDGDGICDNAVDYDGDRVNDITGLRYSRRSLKGFRYGLVDEERGAIHQIFVDEDGDGMDDVLGRGRMLRPGLGMGMDRFVDEDGDGIYDGRTVRGRMGRGGVPGTGEGTGGRGGAGHGPMHPGEEEEEEKPRGGNR